MSCRISLLSTGEHILDYLNTNLSAGAFLEHTELSEYLFNHLEENFCVPDIVVLGLDVNDPIRTAEHILVLKRVIKIVILCKRDQQKLLQKAIQFSPFLNSDVYSFEYKNEDKLLAKIQSLVDSVERFRVYENTIAEAEKERTSTASDRPLVVNYLENLLDKLPIGILNLDSNGNILSLNRSARFLLGRSERELVNKSLQMLFSEEDGMKIISLIDNAVRSEGRNDSAVVFLNEQDIRSYLEVSVSLYSANQTETIVTAILKEVTDKVIEEIKRKSAEQARNESEQQLRLVIDAIPELIAYVDSDLNYQFNNKAFEKWFGSSREEIKGKKIWQVIGDKPYEVVKQYVEMAMSGETVTFEEKVEYPSRGDVYIRSTYVPNYSSSDEVCGFFVLTTDITQSKRLEEGEKKHMLELAHTSRIMTVGEMSTQLAHELSQPLTSIEAYSRANIRLIEKDRTNLEEAKAAFENISTQAKRAQEIMHQLRNFVKKDATRKHVLINDLIRSAIKLLKIEFREQELDIKLDLEDHLPYVMADRILIEQVLINLIKNALEAMQELDSGDRDLSLHSQLLKDSKIAVSVQDSGPGLSDYEFNKIFEPFYTTKPEGMGMGLAITHSIIKSHDGELHAVGNKHGGTTFKFTLPVVEEN